MGTKTTIARKIADEGIDVYIANGKTDNILLKLLDKKANVICTRFVASTDEVSSVKKWIAHSQGFAKGEIHVNENAAKALNGEKAVSLLPIGATKIVGDFEKDDIVKIIDHAGHSLGIGKAQYDSTKSRELLGKKNQKPLVHCDYMYLE
jgi:glutamate 5-kinase